MTPADRLRSPTAGDFLDAIRLATVDPGSSRRALSVIEDILIHAPHGRREGEPVRIFVDSIRNVMPDKGSAA